MCVRIHLVTIVLNQTSRHHQKQNARYKIRCSNKKRSSHHNDELPSAWNVTIHICPPVHLHHKERIYSTSGNMMFKVVSFALENPVRRRKKILTPISSKLSECSIIFYIFSKGQRMINFELEMETNTWSKGVIETSMSNNDHDTMLDRSEAQILRID